MNGDFSPVRTSLFAHGIAKIAGDSKRHRLVQYLGKIPKPEEIKFYTAYNNRECLHCHAGMRKYEEASSHHKNPEMLAQAATNQLSCISSGCHDTVHDVATLKDVTFWTPKVNGK